MKRFGNIGSIAAADGTLKVSEHNAGETLSLIDTCRVSPNSTNIDHLRGATTPALALAAKATRHPFAIQEGYRGNNQFCRYDLATH